MSQFFGTSKKSTVYITNNNEVDNMPTQVVPVKSASVPDIGFENNENRNKKLWLKAYDSTKKSTGNLWDNIVKKDSKITELIEKRKQEKKGIQNELKTVYKNSAMSDVKLLDMVPFSKKWNGINNLKQRLIRFKDEEMILEPQNNAEKINVVVTIILLILSIILYFIQNTYKIKFVSEDNDDKKLEDYNYYLWWVKGAVYVLTGYQFLYNTFKIFIRTTEKEDDLQ